MAQRLRALIALPGVLCLIPGNHMAFALHAARERGVGGSGGKKGSSRGEHAPASIPLTLLTRTQCDWLRDLSCDLSRET